ncbi:MAG TPA: sensor histidine kinase [Streptosporangiaceae bacterium]|jgi:signal transduction histidine kinase
MRTAIRRSAAATGTLLVGLQTALPALFGLVMAVPAVLVLPVLPEAAGVLRSLAATERRRAGRLLGERIPAPYRPLGGGHWRRVRTVVRDPATWRDLLWLVVHGPTGTFAALIAVGLWPGTVSSLTMPLWWWLLPPGTVTAFVEVRTWPVALTLPFVQAAAYAVLLWWLVPVAARVQARFARALLRPTARARLAERVEELTETRTEALESHGAELRRIERDLHDGVQAQLVSIAVRLGLAERSFTGEPDTALAFLRDARTGIEDSLTQLRTVIRGIYPPILADRGLDGAVRAIAGGQRIPVTVRVPEGLPRPPAPVEAAAYFVVAESLTNVSRHSAAASAEVTVEPDGAELRVRVRDDGRGGADPDLGTGLLGIRRRVAALDGTVHIHSPRGGGTTIEVRLPCAS